MSPIPFGAPFAGASRASIQNTNPQMKRAPARPVKTLSQPMTAASRGPRKTAADWPMFPMP